MNNKLTAAQKSKIIDISQKMSKKRFKSRPYFENFFLAVVSSIQLHGWSGQKVDNLLTVTEKTLEQNSDKMFEQYLLTIGTFMDTKFLYQNRSNRLRVIGGNFDVEYREVAAPSGSFDDMLAKEEPKKEDPKKKDTKKAQNDEWADWSWDDEPSSNESSSNGWGDVPDPNQKQVNIFDQGPIVKPMPDVTGPTLVLKETDIWMISPYDSVVIKKTDGELMLTSNTFVGHGGRFDWDASGVQAWAEFKDYTFDITKAEFRAESATIHHDEVLEEPVDGVFEFRSTRRNKDGSSSFPRFISFTNNARIKNIGENIKYQGGFSMAGNKIMTACLDEKNSDISVFVDGVKKFKSSARSYELGDSLITSKRAAVTIYMGQDSLRHLAMRFKYSKPQRVLTLIKDEGAFKKTPFTDSYHQMEITAELLTWDLATSDINFSVLNAKNQIPAKFESIEYYSDVKYQQLMGVASFHPLQVLTYYAQKAKMSQFYASEVARFNKGRVSESAVRAAAEGLARQGFVDYNSQTGYISLRDKALHYLNAARGSKDYDHISLSSVSPSGRNATLDLKSNVLTVRGVDRFYFNADSAAVYAVPDSGIVRIRKNREIEFSGKVYSANYTFRGEEFKFDYNKFMIDMPKIDSITVSFQSVEKDKDGKEELKVQQTTLTQSTGTFYLNHPGNKSGRKKIAGYPMFNAETGAYVYFNKPNILRGAYDSTVYFAIPPFKLDSLNSGSLNAIAFEGEFHSGGIFPVIKTKLTVMEDKSMGFTYPAPKGGFPLYGDKGRFFQDISMTASGLRGKGQIKYLNATLNSDDFIFYLDSVTTLGTTGIITEGKLGNTTSPNVALNMYDMKWEVKEDSMHLQDTEEPLKMYNEKFAFRGKQTLTPSGLVGDGEIENEASIITAPHLAFEQTQFKGHNALMEVKSDTKGKPAVSAEDVFFTFDIKNGFADFSPERAGFASTQFPYSQYKTSLSGGKWEFSKKIISMKVPEGSDLNNNYFQSLHPDQNGLKFNAATAVYDLSSFTLTAGGVPHIASADGYVEPDSNIVHVMANGDIKAFQNAKITLDTLSRFHTLYKGEIDIFSRDGFMGYATYKYVNAENDTFNIRFGNFTVDSILVKDEPPIVFTKAVGTVEETQNFYISPGMKYKGEVYLYSNKDQLEFDGYTKLALAGDDASAEWFPFKSNVNPLDVKLTLDKKMESNGELLKTGLHVANATGNLYTSFASQKADPSDLDVFIIDGELTFDKNTQEFRIAKGSKATGEGYQGNLLTMNKSTNEMKFEGKLNFIKSSREFGIEASGMGVGNPSTSKYTVNSFMAFDMAVPAQALDVMATDLTESSFGAMEAIDGGSDLLYKMAEFIGDQGVQDYTAKTASGYVPLSKISPKFIRSMVFANIPLKWSPKNRAWYSEGPLKLAGVMKKDVNIQLNGYVEIKRGGEYDVVVLYLESGPDTWYYFSLYENALTMVSSNDKFNEIIAAKSKGPSNNMSYTFLAGEPMEKGQFLNYFRNTYQAGQSPTMQVQQTPPPVPAAKQTPGEGGLDAAFDSEADTQKKGKKKGKKNKEESTDTFDMPEQTPPATDPEPAVVEEQPAKKKKKAKADENTDVADFPVEEPATTPEEPVKKKKKGKAEEVVESNDAPVEEPAAPEEESPKKKKQKKQKEAEPEPDIDFSN
ncbi:MAG: hypothetical protein LPJ89_04190 [Hymenobacteraceae bacterium]|nr:hypothetical protein [Hymenobacteraceae bacterium]MDX5397333.1 hypothetical protein [Hymenobacteraceae bacterium]MDX5442964.1 hypothetical protein [Hymenobacteraceae bacterium]MDX5513412.1 hypothetical protein [Hymenobacteraceae bacterium]